MQSPDGPPGRLAPLGLQAATEKEADKWAALWEEGAAYEVPQLDLAHSAHPGTIHPWMIKAACATFPATTGLGVDAIQPRALLRLSDEAIHALCQLLMAIELVGAWPALIRLVLIVLLPKADGGRRPIGLLPTIVRVWMRARGPIARSWRAALGKGFLYGGCRPRGTEGGVDAGSQGRDRCHEQTVLRRRARGPG